MKLLLYFILLINISCLAQIKVLENAHAHNDYEHIHPLFDALSYGFNSVEADVHLLKGELYVSHDQPDIKSAKTLEQLYLQPIDSLIRINTGCVYKNHKHPFYLMIDFKTEGEDTYNKLKSILHKYTSLLRITILHLLFSSQVTDLCKQLLKTIHLLLVWMEELLILEKDLAVRSCLLSVLISNHCHNGMEQARYLLLI